MDAETERWTDEIDRKGRAKGAALACFVGVAAVIVMALLLEMVLSAL